MPSALATKATPKLQMTPPPVRLKMKATRPLSKPEPALYVEQVPEFISHSESRSSTKEQAPDSTDVSPSIEELTFHVVSHGHVFQASPTPITREDVEAKTWSNATHLFHHAIEVPRAVVEDNGLYTLITEMSDKWVPKKLVDDLEACIQHLNQQMEDGTIGHRISDAFGKWFLYDNNKVSLSTFIPQLCINIFIMFFITC